MSVCGFYTCMDIQLTVQMKIGGYTQWYVRWVAMLPASSQAPPFPPVGTLGVSSSRFGLSLPPITPSQLPSIKLSPSPTPLCSLAVAISSLFLRSSSSSSDSEICSFLGLRLLHQHPPLCPHLFPCPLSLDLCLSLLCTLPGSLFHFRAGADFV